MMTRIWIALLSLSSITCGYSQLLINPQIPPQGLMQKKQLWNILCVNNTGLPQHVQIQIWLTDSESGQQVLTGLGATLLLQKGTTMLREDDVAPARYQYTGSYTTTDVGAGDWLMPGNYNICYTLSGVDEKLGVPSSEACLNTAVEPLSPPQLISPSDTSMVETVYPAFNWIPPAPLSMFSDLKYELLIVEMKDGQSAYDAIQRNAPLYIQRYMEAPFLLYPSSAKTLDKGKQYAWQVVAKNGAAYAQKTEVWRFRIKKDAAAIIIDNSAYIGLSRGYDAQSYSCQGKMRFAYNNETGDSTAHVNIYLLQDEKRIPVDSKSIPLKQGENFVDIPIGNNGRYQNLQEYVLELTNSRKEQWNLRFRYVKKE